MYTRYNVERRRNFWSRKATLMLLYFMSSYFSSSSPVSLGHRDIPTFSLDRSLESGWCKRVPILYKLQIFPVLLEYLYQKYVLCFVCHSQYRDNLGLIIWLIMNIQYLIPGWVLGWLMSVLSSFDSLLNCRILCKKQRLFFKGSYLWISPVLLIVFRFQRCYKDVIDLPSRLLFVMCFDRLLLFPQFKLWMGGRSHGVWIALFDFAPEVIFLCFSSDPPPPPPNIVCWRNSEQFSRKTVFRCQCLNDASLRHLPPRLLNVHSKTMKHSADAIE